MQVVGMMRPLSWYINRLSKMPPMEIPYRIGHKLKEKQDRYQRFERAFSGTPFHERLKTLSGHVTGKMIEASGNKEAIMVRANHILERRHVIFGHPILYPERIDWHMDPETGTRWPLKFWADIDHRNAKGTKGVKFVWEINRLDFLPSLGLAYLLTGDRIYAEKVLSIVREWQAANPYPLGVNWISGIELGLRIANLAWALSFMNAYPFSEEDYRSLNRFVYFHARHLNRYPSRYSSNNNHALAEAFGLFLSGLYFPHLDKASKWAGVGKEILEREVSRQILPDGGSFEFTTTYLSFVVDFFLLYKQVCDRHGISHGAAVSERLEQSASFIAALMDDVGNLPNIGDQDSAVLVNFGLDNWENFHSFLNTAGILFNRPGLLRKKGPDLKTLLLLGEKALHPFSGHEGAFPSSQSDPPTTSAHLFKESGIAVIHEKNDQGTLHFVGNATPLGMPPLYAHGHLDALSFYLTVDGLEIFVDPGTYLYHGGGEFRRYFRSTAAHNTLRVDQTDFTLQVSDFMFGRPYRILENTLEQEGEMIVWKASHNAYHYLNPGVAHQRKVMYERKAFVFHIQDELRPDGPFFGELFFHFHPACNVTIDNRWVMIRREHIQLIMEAPQAFDIAVYRGERNPLRGWFSHAFNHVVPAFTVVFSGHFKGQKTVSTLIRRDVMERPGG